MLHEQDYEQIELVKRTLNQFKLGPYNFITVKDGFLAGTFEKHGGQFQVLPPGNTYILHEKKYDPPSIVIRSDLFLLGSYYFITVRKNFVAGAYKKKGGEFITLESGSTYQLNSEEYHEPIMVKKDQHLVKCGPLT